MWCVCSVCGVYVCVYLGGCLCGVCVRCVSDVCVWVGVCVSCLRVVGVCGYGECVCGCSECVCGVCVCLCVCGE